MQHMLLFLEVAKNDLGNQQLGVIEMGERLAMTQSSVSRGIRDMSAKNIPPGSDEPINLVLTQADPIDHRKRIPALTPKGRAVYARLVAMMSADQLVGA